MILIIKSSENNYSTHKKNNIKQNYKQLPLFHKLDLVNKRKERRMGNKQKQQKKKKIRKKEKEEKDNLKIN